MLAFIGIRDQWHLKSFALHRTMLFLFAGYSERIQQNKLYRIHFEVCGISVLNSSVKIVAVVWSSSLENKG